MSVVVYDRQWRRAEVYSHEYYSALLYEAKRRSLQKNCECFHVAQCDSLYISCSLARYTFSSRSEWATKSHVTFIHIHADISISMSGSICVCFTFLGIGYTHMLLQRKKRTLVGNAFKVTAVCTLTLNSICVRLRESLTDTENIVGIRSTRKPLCVSCSLAALPLAYYIENIHHSCALFYVSTDSTYANIRVHGVRVRVH